MLRGVGVCGLWCVLAVVGIQVDVKSDDWPQWGGPQRDCVWREQGIVEKFSTDGLLDANGRFQ